MVSSNRKIEATVFCGMPLYSKLYVKTNEVAPEKGRKLNEALKLRNEARYKPNALLSAENAREVIRLADGLIKIISEKTIL